MDGASLVIRLSISRTPARVTRGQKVVQNSNLIDRFHMIIVAGRVMLKSR